MKSVYICLTAPYRVILVPATAFALIVVAILALLIPSRVTRAQSTERFSQVTRRDGLSSDAVLSILQDRSGFLWIGTVNGLNRYDGYRIKTYRAVREDPTSLPHSRVNSMLEDENGRLWLGTHGGLVLYDAALDQFKTFPLVDDPNDTGVIVHGIERDEKGIFWLSTWTSGLIRFDPVRESLEYYTSDLLSGVDSVSTVRTTRIRSDGTMWVAGYRGLFEFDPTDSTFRIPDLSADVRRVTDAAVIFEILTVSDREVWLSSFDGVYRLDPLTSELDRFEVPDEDPQWRTVRALHADSRGSIWAGTEGGLAMISRATGVVTPFYSNPTNPHSISRGSISVIYEDNSGVLWLGSDERGLNATDLYRTEIATYLHDPLHPGRFPLGHIWDVEEAVDGTIWLATTLGLSRWDPVSGSYHSVDEFGNTVGIPSLLRDSTGRLWVGSEGNGVCLLDEYMERCRWFESSLLPNRNVYALAEHSNGSILIGTFRGAVAMDPDSGGISQIYTDVHGPRPTFVQSIATGADGNLWIGAENGLFKVDSVGRMYRSARADLHEAVRSAGFVDVNRSNDGLIWYVHGDVVSMDPITNDITVYGVEAGLPQEVARSITIDTNGMIWVFYDAHLARIDPESGSTDVYSDLLGSLSLQNWTGASEVLDDGRLLFGFEDGLYLFDPSLLEENPFKPRTLFTEFHADGREQMPTLDGLLRTSITLTDRLELQHHTSTLEIGFASSHMANPDANRFRVKLDNFNETWATIQSPVVTYSSLAPDTYTLRVVARSPGGLEAEEARLTIVVFPPWWKTVWFRFLSAIAVISAAILTYQIRMRAVLESNRRLEQKVTDRTRQIDAQKERLAQQAEQLIEADRSKSRFFSNVSHELKTPLTLIQAYLLKLQEEAGRRLEPRERERIERSLALTDRLDSLVLQLLELARSDAGRLTLNLQSVELCQFVQRIVTHFSVAAAAKSIQLVFEMEQTAVRTDCDPVKLDQIISNLVGNALKFTPERGKIWVTLSADRREDDVPMAVIRVADTGQGIEPEKLGRVFDRFYQVGDPLTRTSDGLGLGLSLSKDFAVLHGGTLDATSEPASGSVFTVRIPIRRPADAEDSDILPTGSARYVDVVREDQIPGREDEKLRDKVVLVAEDNPELRQFLEEILVRDFQVISAQDGKRAWDLLQDQRPDILLSDVMMPGLNGLDLLQRVRDDERFASLPVVLLTARASVEDEVAGLTARADDFIAKPFNAEVLRTRLVNLVENRREYAGLSAFEANTSSEDQEFLNRMHLLVSENAGCDSMNVAEIAGSMFMSERTFQRKVKQVTGQSAGAYLRYVRLKHARRLLEVGSVTSVSQAARESGFQNVSHFSRVYMETFGIDPSTYL